MSRTTDHNERVPVSITADTSTLSKEELWLLTLLLEAARQIDVVYRRQSGQSPGEPGSSFDPGRPKNFYPEGVSAAMIETYLAGCPHMREEILSPFTVVVGAPEGFRAIPYSTFYKKELATIACLLDQAAGVARDHRFRHFLRMKSEAFLTNRYRESDIAWVHANSGPFELTIGPYESYEDPLFGVKRAFECLLGLVLSAETQMAAGFQEFVTMFDAALGEQYGYTARTTLTPMVVMDELYATGEARYEHLPMAYNLPNDLDIHADVGSKKVFIRNVMRAKFETITLPIASRVLPPEDAAQFDFDAYLKFVIGHESAHGLSFHFDGERFGPMGSGIEECKADVFGMVFLYFLEDQGFLAPPVASTAVVEHLTDCLRQIRFGPHRAHAVGAIVQYNWFIERGALRLTADGLVFDRTQFRAAATSLGDALYALVTSEDQATLEGFVSEWGRKIPEPVLTYLERFADLPVDIEPVFAF